MPTRNIVITEHQDDLLERLVQSGRYRNASEILREGLRLLEQRETEESIRLQLLREAASMRDFSDLASTRFNHFDDVDASDPVAPPSRFDAATNLRQHLTALAEDVLAEAEIGGALSTS